jgi:hypothetical protein
VHSGHLVEAVTLAMVCSLSVFMFSIHYSS